MGFGAVDGHVGQEKAARVGRGWDFGRVAPYVEVVDNIFGE